MDQKYKEALADVEQRPSFSQTSPPPSYKETTRPTEKLQIKYGDWRNRHGELIDATTGSTTYTCEHHYRKPTFVLKTPDGRQIATAGSHMFTMKMDMDVDGNHFELTPSRKFGNDCTYVSPTFGGQTLTWKHSCSWSRIEYVCTDERGLSIARFKSGSSLKCWSGKSFGDLEFADGRVQTEAQRNEIVATGLTLAYRAIVNQSTATTVAVTA